MRYLPSKQPSSPGASPRLRYMLSYFHHLVRIEVQAYHGIITLWMFRLLLDAQAIALLTKLCHTISLRVTYPITKDGSFAILLTDTSQHQYRDRIIYHRLVKDRNQLLADTLVIGYKRIPLASASSKLHLN